MMWKMQATGARADIDDGEVRRAFKLLPDPRYTFEIRGVPSGRSFFHTPADEDKAVASVRELSGDRFIYYALNPLPNGCTKPANNKNIIERRWFLIDVDTVKKEGFEDDPSTDEEKERSREVASAVAEFLSDLGWPSPLIVDSGNGWQILYRIDLPNDPMSQTLLKKILHGLGERFSGDVAEIDKSVHNASRLAKLPGTMARKGTAHADRPYRMAKLHFVPTELIALTNEQLNEAAKTLDGKEVKDEPPATLQDTSHPTTTFRLSINSTNKSAYGKAALEREAALVAIAPNKSRNNTLNKAAFRLGQLIPNGYLERGDIEDTLFYAALRCGLHKDAGGEAAIRKTIQSGMTAGMEFPRTAEERKGKSEKKTSEKNKDGSQNNDGPQNNDEPLTVCLASVESKKILWLVQDRIPRQFITIFAGRTGVGKSFVALDLVARISSGGEIPFSGGQKFTPGGVLLISEDSHEYVLAPRLIEAGANMQKIRAMTWKAMASYDLSDAAMLERACGEVGDDIQLVLIDPPTNFLKDADEHKNTDVRQVIMNVVEWLQMRQIAVVFILHVNKNTGKGVEALNRVMGSVAWVTTSRIAHSFNLDPDDPERGLFIPMKNNLGPLAKGIAYQVVKTDGLAKVKWIEEVDTTADEAMAGSSGKPRKVVASEWLIEKFREKLEWKSDELFKAASEEGVSKNAIFEAKQILDLPKAKKVTHETGDTSWVWWVPEGWEKLAKEDDDGKINDATSF